MTDTNETTTDAATEKPQRDCYFRAPFAAMLSQFISREAVRYYLQGIYVTQHPGGGVLLVATDGHRMGVAYDSEGYTNGDWICPIPAPIMDAVKLKAKKLAFGNDSNPLRLWFRGPVVHLMDVSDLPPGGFAPDMVGERHTAISRKPAIDHEFPEWPRVVPRVPGTVGVLEANARYLASFAKVAKYGRALGLCDDSYGVMTLWQEHEGDPLQIRIKGLDCFYGILMPMRREAKEPKPEWLSAFLDSMKKDPA